MPAAALRALRVLSETVAAVTYHLAALSRYSPVSAFGVPVLPIRDASASAAEPPRSGSERSALDTAALEEMVAGLRRGDQQTMGAFFERFAPMVRGTLRRLIGVTDDLEDQVHDVFVQAIDGIDRLREPALLPAWMRGITVIQAKRKLQRQYRRRWLKLSATGETPELPEAPVDHVTREAFRSIQDIFGQLRPEDRIAIVLRRVDGLTIADAADAMQLSVSTFKRRLRRGEERLRLLAGKSPALQGWLEKGTGTP